MPSVTLRRENTGFSNRTAAIKVYVDGDSVGRLREEAPLRFELNPGEHSISLRINWVRSADHKIRVVDGQNAHLKVVLNKARDATLLFRPSRYLQIEADD